jgi:hypothetical protein
MWLDCDSLFSSVPVGAGSKPALLRSKRAGLEPAPTNFNNYMTANAVIPDDFFASSYVKFYIPCDIITYHLFDELIYLDKSKFIV